MPRRKAVITGITGQDGGYLARLLRSKGYEIHGLANRREPEGTEAGIRWHIGDLTDTSRLLELLDRIRPDEVYNLAAQSQVRLSFEMPLATANVNALGTLCLLEAVRQHGRPVRFLQPGSGDMFGENAGRCSETTPFHPRSPYATSKVYAYWQAVNYREAYGMFICNAILFNHESPRRPAHFVTRKITRAAARISLGLQRKLPLGNLKARRDWGFAEDYVEAMWRMVQQKKPDDYVIATGETHSVREFCEEAFRHLGLDWRKHVELAPEELRAMDITAVCGDASKARRKLGWKPRVDFRSLVRMMVDADVKVLQHASPL